MGEQQNLLAFEGREERRISPSLPQIRDFLEDGRQARNGNNTNSSTTRRVTRSGSRNSFRHTGEQIQHLEEVFKECQNPDEVSRRKLSRELGLMPSQIKFWFQNKRTQIKKEHERDENFRLRAENEYLKTKNARCREILEGASCPTCTAASLRLQNNQLRQQIMRQSAIAAQYCKGENGVNEFFPDEVQQTAGGAMFAGAADSYNQLIYREARDAEDEAGNNVGTYGNDWSGASEIGFGGWGN